MQRRAAGVLRVRQGENAERRVDLSRGGARHELVSGRTHERGDARGHENAMGARGETEHREQGRRSEVFRLIDALERGGGTRRRAGTEEDQRARRRLGVHYVVMNRTHSHLYRFRRRVRPNALARRPSRPSRSPRRRRRRRVDRFDRSVPGRHTRARVDASDSRARRDDARDDADVRERARARERRAGASREREDDDGNGAEAQLSRKVAKRGRRPPPNC